MLQCLGRQHHVGLRIVQDRPATVLTDQPARRGSRSRSPPARARCRARRTGSERQQPAVGLGAAADVDQRAADRREHRGEVAPQRTGLEVEESAHGRGDPCSGIVDRLEDRGPPALLRAKGEVLCSRTRLMKCLRGRTPGVARCQIWPGLKPCASPRESLAQRRARPPAQARPRPPDRPTHIDVSQLRAAIVPHAGSAATRTASRASSTNERRVVCVPLAMLSTAPGSARSRSPRPGTHRTRRRPRRSRARCRTRQVGAMARERVLDQRWHQPPGLLPRPVDRVEPERDRMLPVGCRGQSAQLCRGHLGHRIVRVRLDRLDPRMARGPAYRTPRMIRRGRVERLPRARRSAMPQSRGR